MRDGWVAVILWLRAPGFLARRYNRVKRFRAARCNGVRGDVRMRIVNRRTGAVLADRVEKATSVRARLRGLLGRKGLDPGSALVIAPCTSIHTFFMQFTIDAAFLGRDGRVIRAISSLRPWRATRIYPAATMVVEFREGALADGDVREGDTLAFEE